MNSIEKTNFVIKELS